MKNWNFMLSHVWNTIPEYMNTNKILSHHHLLTHLKLYMTLSCQIQFRTSFANQFGKQCVILTLHSNSSSHRQHALFLSCPLVGLLCFGLSFNLQFYPWKCVSKPGICTTYCCCRWKVVTLDLNNDITYLWN